MGGLRGLARRLLRRSGPGPVPLLLGDRAVPLFFVVGRAKSGTSWLMNMLDSHPEILCGGEGRFFGTEHPMGAEGARSLEHALRHSGELQDWAERSSWTRQSAYPELARAWTPVLARSVMAGALAASGKSTVGDKTPLNGPGVVGAIGELLPEARVIQIIRDGRDVAVSSAHHRWNQLGARAEPTAEQQRQLEIGAAYRADPRGFIEAGHSIFGPEGPAPQAEDWARLTIAARGEGARLGGERYTEVRYEDLMESGEAELQRLFRFLGVDDDHRHAHDCFEANRFERLSAGRPAGVEDSGAFLRSGTIGDWRRVFTDSDRDAFRRATGATLIELGYEASEDW